MKHKARTWLPPLLLLGALSIFVVFSTNGRTDEPVEAEHDTAIERSVTVVPVRAETRRPLIESFGAVRPTFSVTLAAEIEATVVSLARYAHSGARARQGQVLIELDDSRQHQMLAEAQSRQDIARLRHAEELLRSEQARLEWERAETGGKPSSYLLREPQTLAAQSDMAAAAAALEEARLNIDRAQIRAPFNAAVIRRNVSPGSYVQPGNELIEIYGTDRFEIRLPLATRQWAVLPDERTLTSSGWEVELNHQTGEGVWIGRVCRVERHMIPETRQRALVICVEDPLDQQPPMLPGMFVRAEIPGKLLDSVLVLPASAMTDREEVWFVDPNEPSPSTLRRFSVSPLFASRGQLLVPVPEGLDTVHVLPHPMLSYLEGMRVHARVENHGES